MEVREGWRTPPPPPYSPHRRTQSRMYATYTINFPCYIYILHHNNRGKCEFNTEPCNRHLMAACIVYFFLRVCIHPSINKFLYTYVAACQPTLYACAGAYLPCVYFPTLCTVIALKYVFTPSRICLPNGRARGGIFRLDPCFEQRWYLKYGMRRNPCPEDIFDV